MNQMGLNERQFEINANLPNGTLQGWKNGKASPSRKTLDKIAQFCKKPLSWFYEDHTITAEYLAQEFSENDMYQYQVIGTICAGYDGVAEESYTGEDIVVPPHLIKTRNPNDYFVLEVKGDSMFPLLENGDKVLIRRCDSVDSGTVAAVGFNYEQATVKKVEYVKGENWMRLVPRNPEYPVITIKDSDLQLCRVYGEVVYLFRERINF